MFSHIKKFLSFPNISKDVAFSIFKYFDSYDSKNDFTMETPGTLFETLQFEMETPGLQVTNKKQHRSEF